MLRKHILPSLGRVCVDQLSTKAFTSFAAKQIDSELSQKTLKDIGTLLKGVLKYAETTFNCSSPAHGAKLPKYRQNMPEIFSDAEINSIANRVLDVPSILGIAILLTLNSGLRLGRVVCTTVVWHWLFVGSNFCPAHSTEIDRRWSRQTGDPAP